jgi:Protein of unknown function (DUF4239)
MSILAAMLVIFGSSLVAILISVLVRRMVRLDLRRRHHEVGSTLFLQIGVMFAVLLAFVFSEAFTEYNAAAQAINAECGDLHGTAMLAHDLPAGMGDKINAAIATYIASVIHIEWPDMERQHESLRADEDIHAVLDAIARADVERRQDVTVRDQVLTLMADAHAQRETRLFQMQNGVPPLLWALLIAFGLVLAAFVIGAGIDSLMGQVLFSGLFTGCTALILVMIRMLDYPFQGALALRPDDFEGTLVKVSGLVGRIGGI